MPLSGAEQAQLDAILYRLALGEPMDHGDYAYAFKRAEELLKTTVDASEGATAALRLRLAMHLAPPDAIDYRSVNRSPRRTLIRLYLVNEFGLPEEPAGDLARAVAQVLSDWQQRRTGVTGWRDALLKSQDGRCAHCRYKINFPLSNEQYTDPYKPYAANPDLYCAPEVDHVEAVSALGSNSEANLQVLCALCNRGKGQGFGLSVADEHRHAATPVEQIPAGARATMLFYVITRASNTCEACGEKHAELTVRPRRQGGPYIRSNLRAVCRACA